MSMSNLARQANAFKPQIHRLPAVPCDFLRTALQCAQVLHRQGKIHERRCPIAGIIVILPVHATCQCSARHDVGDVAPTAATLRAKAVGMWAKKAAEIDLHDVH